MKKLLTFDGRGFGFMAIILLVSSCATGPNQDAAKSSLEYTKNIDPVLLKDVSTKDCDASLRFLERSDWKKVIASANSCAKVKDFKKVDAIGDYLAKRYHHAPWGAYYLGLAAFERGDLERAAWMNELAMKKAPNQGLLVFQKGRIQWRLEDHDIAIKTFEAAIKLEPHLLDARLILGQIYQRDGELKKAKSHYDVALGLDSRLQKALIGLAECELQLGNFARSRELFERAIKEQPKEPSLRLKQAHILENFDKDFTRALEVYRNIQKNHKEAELTRLAGFDVGRKVKELEVYVQNMKAEANAAQREPAETKNN